MTQQIVGTPRNFLDAVEARFAPIDIDLAATAENKVCDLHIGPGSEWCEDFFVFDFSALLGTRRTFWLNPPFGKMDKFAEVLQKLRKRRGYTLMLVPASVDTLWWAAFVHNQARVYFLHPRITFVGHTNAYLRPLALCVYGFGEFGYEPWRWK